MSLPLAEVPPAPRGHPADVAGDLAIVLHSHMPYVEGFGTYPFGEEWLFEAVARSHLPVLEVADRLTMTITPVLADQLEADGVGERLLEFLKRYRLATAERDAAEADQELRPAARAEAEHYALAIERLEAPGGRALAAFQEASASGRVELMASCATHAVLPKLATEAGRRFQIDAGLRSHRRRFGGVAGLWLPECAFGDGVGGLLAEAGLSFTCIDQSATEAGDDALVPASMPGGTTAFTIDWPMVQLVWSGGGYPADPAFLEYHRLSANGTRLWAIAGGGYDPAAAAERAAAHAGSFLESVAQRLRAHAERAGRPGLCVFAIDTELLGHWWAEGPAWLGEVIARAEGQGVRLVQLSDALAEHPADQRELHPSSWGEGKSLETWDSPAVADMAWAARRLELRLIRALTAGGIEPAAAHRAGRELLAVQASDWAFMDHRGQAGDYAYRRAVTHAAALLEALDGERADPLLRGLAPDLSLAPLQAP